MPSIHEEICAGCGYPIRDKYLYKINDNVWHEQCLLCVICRRSLSGTCYSKNGHLYCKADYDKLFRGRCNGCGFNINAHELVRRVYSNTYHLQCFRCVRCGHILQDGNEFYIKDGQILCRFDYDEEELLTFSPTCKGDDDSDSYEDFDLDPDRQAKRPRTILTTSQRRKFKQAFEANPKPCRKIREQLAAETGLTIRVVQVWFQNQRAKVKKTSRKGVRESTEKGRKRKVREDSDKDGFQEFDELNKGTSDNEGSLYSNMDSGSNAFLDMPTSDDSAESPVQSRLDQCQDNNTTCPTNHINKLYSMQTSYFCAE